jgi:phenylacetate-CoA ligase
MMNLQASLRLLFNRTRGYVSWIYKSWRGEVDAQYMSSLCSGEWISIDMLRELQWKKLKTLIEHAFNSVPFYSHQMSGLGIQPSDINSSADFEKLPILTKRDVRERQRDLISTKYEIGSLSSTRTGGSTGEPVKVYLDRGRVRLATTDEIWADGLSGWKIGEPIARLWGAPEVAPTVAWPRRLIRRYLLTPGFVIEAYELTVETFLRFVHNYRRWQPTLVVGYSSSLKSLSRFLLDEGLKLIPPKAVVSTAELLDNHTRGLIEAAFDCPVIDRYGSREIGLIACQCSEARYYHVNMQRVYLEIVSNNYDQVGPDESGKVIITDLGNYGMPLIRYDIGDRAKWTRENQCICGRQSDCLALLEGRTFDFLVSSDGRKIHGLSFNRLLFEIAEISQYRLVQESRSLVRIKVVEDKPISSAKVNTIITMIKEKMGRNIVVNFERVASLPKSPSGKLRYSECNLSPEDLAEDSEC